MSMDMLGLKSGWLKMLALGGIAVMAVGCKSDDGPDVDDFYEPSAHYERHPIIVTKSGAHAKKCGVWPEDLTKTEQNEPYENFGCSQQSNIAAMVANPQDLVKPRRQTPSDPMRRVKVYDNYRSGEEISSAEEKKQQVEISKVAQ